MICNFIKLYLNHILLSLLFYFGLHFCNVGKVVLTPNKTVNCFPNSVMTMCQWYFAMTRRRSSKRQLALSSIQTSLLNQRTVYIVRGLYVDSLLVCLTVHYLLVTFFWSDHTREGEISQLNEFVEKLLANWRWRPFSNIEFPEYSSLPTITDLPSPKILLYAI